MTVLPLGCCVSPVFTKYTDLQGRWGRTFQEQVTLCPRNVCMDLKWWWCQKSFIPWKGLEVEPSSEAWVLYKQERGQLANPTSFLVHVEPSVILSEISKYQQEIQTICVQSNKILF